MCHHNLHHNTYNMTNICVNLSNICLICQTCVLICQTYAHNKLTTCVHKNGHNLFAPRGYTLPCQTYVSLRHACVSANTQTPMTNICVILTHIRPIVNVRRTPGCILKKVYDQTRAGWFCQRMCVFLAHMFVHYAQ